MPDIRVRDVPLKLHKRFHIRCIKEDVKVGDKIIELITEYLKVSKKAKNDE